MAILLKLCVRYIKLKDISVNLDSTPNSAGTSQTEVLVMMEEFLRILLLLVGVMLRFVYILIFALLISVRHRTRLSNIALLYCFVRKHQDTISIFNHAHIMQLLNEILVNSTGKNYVTCKIDD